MTGDLVSDKIGDKITGISSNKTNKSKSIDELFQKHGKKSLVRLEKDPIHRKNANKLLTCLDKFNLIFKTKRRQKKLQICQAVLKNVVF